MSCIGCLFVYVCDCGMIDRLLFSGSLVVQSGGDFCWCMGLLWHQCMCWLGGCCLMHCRVWSFLDGLLTHVQFDSCFWVVGCVG